MPAQRGNSQWTVTFQGLQNKVLRTIGNLPRHTPIRNLHRSFKIQYLYDFVTELCREQAIVILNHDVIRTTGQGEAHNRKHKRLKFGGGQAYDRSIV